MANRFPFWQISCGCYLLLVCVGSLMHLVDGQNWLTEQLLPADYNKDEVPIESNSENATLPMNSSIELSSFTVSEKDQTVKTGITLCLQWSDYRLKDLTSVVIPNDNGNQTVTFTQIMLTKVDSLWIPSVYFRNSIEASVVDALEKVTYAIVWPSKKLLKYCSKMTVTFTCHFRFSNFPFDEQYCPFELEDFDKQIQRLSIQMENFTTPEGNSKLRIRRNLKGTCEPFFKSVFYKPDGNQTNFNQSCAYAGLHLVRRVNYYVIRYYAPTFLMVLMSFAHFWLPTNAWPARVMLTATVLLTLITTSQNGYNEIPAHDVVSLYWWFWGCQFFVYLALVEYAIALAWVQFVVEKKLAYANKRESPDGYYFGKNGWYASCGDCIGSCLRGIFGPTNFFERPEERNKVDYFSRVMFPFMFFLFVLIYILATVPVWSEKYRFR